MGFGRYKRLMSNELLLIGATAVGLAAIATVVRRFSILLDPATSAPQRIRLAVRDADPHRLARIALLDLQRSADARSAGVPV